MFVVLLCINSEWHELLERASDLVYLWAKIIWWLWFRSTWTTWCLHASWRLLLVEWWICLWDFAFIMNTQHEMFSQSQPNPKPTLLIRAIDKRFLRWCNWMIMLTNLRSVLLNIDIKALIRYDWITIGKSNIIEAVQVSLLIFRRMPSGYNESEIMGFQT